MPLRENLIHTPVRLRTPPILQEREPGEIFNDLPLLGGPVSIAGWNCVQNYGLELSRPRLTASSADTLGKRVKPVAKDGPRVGRASRGIRPAPIHPLPGDRPAMPEDGASGGRGFPPAAGGSPGTNRPRLT